MFSHNRIECSAAALICAGLVTDIFWTIYHKARGYSRYLFPDYPVGRAQRGWFGCILSKHMALKHVIFMNQSHIDGHSAFTVSSIATCKQKWQFLIWGWSWQPTFEGDLDNRHLRAILATNIWGWSWQPTLFLQRECWVDTFFVIIRLVEFNSGGVFRKEQTATLKLDSQYCRSRK